jgi:hypothetical protein
MIPSTLFTTQRPIVDLLIAMAYATSPTPSGHKTVISESTSSEIFKDDPLWEGYVKQAAEFDGRMVDEWNKIVDVILVYVSISCNLHDISCLLSNRL